MLAKTFSHAALAVSVFLGSLVSAAPLQGQYTTCSTQAGPIVTTTVMTTSTWIVSVPTATIPFPRLVGLGKVTTSSLTLYGTSTTSSTGVATTTTALPGPVVCSFGKKQPDYPICTSDHVCANAYPDATLELLYCEWQMFVPGAQVPTLQNAYELTYTEGSGKQTTISTGVMDDLFIIIGTFENWSDASKTYTMKQTATGVTGDTKLSFTKNSQGYSFTVTESKDKIVQSGNSLASRCNSINPSNDDNLLGGNTLYRWNSVADLSTF